MNSEKINILLIDDDRADRRLVKLALQEPWQSVNYSLITAPNLTEGFEKLNCGTTDTCQGFAENITHEHVGEPGTDGFNLDTRFLHDIHAVLE